MNSKQRYIDRMEKKQQKIDADPMSARYPDVTSIVILMDYYNKGIGKVMMKRTVNFFPSSAAYFHMGCMNQDCLDGGYDLGHVINSMVRGHLESGQGDLGCLGNNSHARIDYKVTIQYDNTVHKKPS